VFGCQYTRNGKKDKFAHAVLYIMGYRKLLPTWPRYVTTIQMPVYT